MENESDVENDLFSRTQQLVLEVLPYVTAPPSALGSALILYVILADKHTRIETFQRLMLGMSLLDLVSSTGMIVLGHWAVPAGTEYVVGARGNNATCTASYWLLNCLFGSMWYSAFLACYFMLLVRFHWPKRRIAIWIEPFAHLSAFVTTLIVPLFVTRASDATAVYVLPGFCWAIYDRPGCNEDEDSSRCTDDSTGTSATHYIVGLFGFILVCMILIFRQVRQTDQYLQRHAADANSRQDANKDIATEALLYSSAFFVVFFPLVPYVYVDEWPASTNRNRRSLFVLGVLTKLLTPLQGSFNALIYVRGRFRALNEEADGAMTLGMFAAYLNDTTSCERVGESVNSIEVPNVNS